MNRFLKKATCMVFGTMLALTGCGGNTQETSGNTPTQVADNTSGEKTKIVYWSNVRHDMEYVQQKIDEYNATNDKNVEVVYETMAENYDNNLELSFQSNQAPDVFRVKSEIAPYVNKGLIVPIDEFLTEEDYKKYGDTLGIPNINKYNDKIYTVPQFGNTFRLIYNKDVFEKAGLDPNAPPKTMAELREYAKIITEKLGDQGVYGFAMNLKNASSSMYRSVDEVARLSDMLYYDFKEGKYTFEKYGEVAQVFADMYADGSFFPGVESLDIDPLRAQFALGNIGMYMSGYWEVAVYDSQFETDQNWAAAQLPTLNGEVKGVNAINSAGRSFAISSQTKNKEAAWDFIKFMTSEEYTIDYHEKGYGIVVVPSIAEKAKPSTAYGSEYFVLSETDKIVPLSPELAGLVVEGKTFYEAFTAAIMGAMSIEDAVNQMNESYNTALEKAISSGSFAPIITE